MLKILTVALIGLLATQSALAQKEDMRAMRGAATKNLASGYLSFIGGGFDNTASGNYSVIGGGLYNVAEGSYSAIAGGDDNLASGWGSTVAGGALNIASADTSVVGGGLVNEAFGMRSTIAGGEDNAARGSHATITGGRGNCAGGDYSWAGGLHAKARPAVDPGTGPCASLGTQAGPSGDAGTFVWADNAGTAFVSTASNQFLVRAGGGAALNANTAPLHTTLLVKGRPGSNGNANLYLEHANQNIGFNLGVGVAGAGLTQMYFARFNRTGYTDLARFRTDGRFEVFVDNPVKPLGGSWAAPSDARLKEGVKPLHGALAKLLSLHGVEFRYRDDAPDRYYVPGTHVGFVAQDVETVFPDWVGRDSDGYRLVGPRGFEALTVEALRELRAQGQAEIAALQAENVALREDLAAMRAEMVALREIIAPAIADAR